MRPKRLNPLMARLESGQAAVGIWTAAYSTPRIAKVVARSGADFIVADIEHDLLDHSALQRFLLQTSDFGSRFAPGLAPAVLVKLGHRAGWEPRYEIASTLRSGPAMGIWIPFVESRQQLEAAISAVRHNEAHAHAGLNLPAERRDLWPLNPDAEYLVVGIIESAEGAQNAEAIIATPGLSAMEIVHLPDDDTKRIRDLCHRHSVIAAATVRPEDVGAMLDAGYRLVAIG
ncbi:aldolase/citrate lyase family protein [Rhizobium terrae]|uniref:aldolase/citrate lyase family protein n=1 Tax=Rhizobium terrae TaxID=2171756 RepID=UPI0013C2FC8D|nr:aldolase/citrate lyase family protein [Rhizobium terrae]